MSTTATSQAPPTENIYGIAKRISLDLEKLPLHTHAAIINIVNTMCQHRKIVLESEAQQAQIDAQEAAMADARKAHAEKQAAYEQAIAAEITKEGLDPGSDSVPTAAALAQRAQSEGTDPIRYASAYAKNFKRAREAQQMETKPPRLSIVLDKPGDPSAADLDAVVAERAAAAVTLGEPMDPKDVAMQTALAEEAVAQ